MSRKPRLLWAASCVLAACLVSACSQPTEGRSQNLAGLRVGDVLGQQQGVDNAGFLKADQPRTLVFPYDHGPHEGFRSEWWYLTLVLSDDNGREYGAQFTVFRQALTATPGEGPWMTGQAFMAHLAVTDVEGGRHLHAERLARGHPRLAGATAVPFRVHLEDWQLASAGSSGNDLTPLVLSAREDDWGIDLKLEQRRPVMLQGNQGLSAKGPGQASYYYSIPRMAVSGQLLLPDGGGGRGEGAVNRKVTVQGLGWFDREWGTSVLSAGVLGWDWFALQLDDGRDILAFRLRREDGERDNYDYAIMRNVAGDERQFSADTFTLLPIRWWSDGDTRWPVAWRLRLASAGENEGENESEGEGEERGQEFVIDAALDDQVMDLSIRYWEGLMRVYQSDSNGDRHRIGSGYAEFTGY